jgi:hypothetical protein
VKVLLLYYYDESAWAQMADEERRDALQRIQRWQEQPEHAGRILQTGEVPSEHQILTVHLGPAGWTDQPRIVSGPFAQAPLALGGYTVVEVADLDEAAAWVQDFPTGGAVEIRPLVES